MWMPEHNNEEYEVTAGILIWGTIALAVVILITAVAVRTFLL